MTIEPISIPYKLRQRADTYWTHRASDQADLDRASADRIEQLEDLLTEALDSEISDYWYVRVKEAIEQALDKRHYE